eukprot:15438801-Alexandrium_andersonii.AAC.1
MDSNPSLAPWASDEERPKSHLKAAIMFLESMAEEGLTNLAKHIDMYFHMGAPSHVVYFPAGYLILERALMHVYIARLPVYSPGLHGLALQNIRRI